MSDPTLLTYHDRRRLAALAVAPIDGHGAGLEPRSTGAERDDVAVAQFERARSPSRRRDLGEDVAAAQAAADAQGPGEAQQKFLAWLGERG
jgi:hypothetical protein